MPNPIHLLIISPEKTWLRCDVAWVELPGDLGRFTVLKDHAPLISSLATGTVRFAEEGGEVRQLAIRAGFAEVRDNRVTLAVER